MLTEVIPSFAKPSPYSPAKHLFCLKNGQTRRFNQWKCSKWVCLEVSWVDFECFYAILWRSRWLLNRFFATFYPFFTILSLFRAKNGSKWRKIRAKRVKIGQNLSFLGDFGAFSGSGVIFGSLGDRFGIILARFGVVLTPFWGLFGAFLTLLGGFWAFLGQKPVILRGFGQKNVLKP